MGPIPLLIALGMFVNGAELVDFLIEYTAEVVFCGNHARDLQQMALSVYNTSGSTALVAYKYGQTVDLLQTLRVVYQYGQTVESQQTLRAVGSAALVVYQHGSSRLHMSAARGYVVYQYAYEYVFAQPVCPVPTEQGCPAPPESPGSGGQMPINKPGPPWTLPVMVVPFLVMLLLGFWVMMVLYHKKKGVAKPTVGAEPGIDETVSAESEIAAPVIEEPVPEEPVIEEPLPVKPDSDTPARVGLSTTASADHRLEMFQFKMRLAKA